MRNWVTLIAFVLLLPGCAASPPTSVPVAGNVERGAQLFSQGRGDIPSCSSCHHTIEDQLGFSIGPILNEIGERAATQVDGMTEEAYLRQSIIEPKRHIVPGYRDIMYPDYSAHFTEQDIQDLIAYLLTL
jgi:cytochrome c2